MSSTREPVWVPSEMDRGMFKGTTSTEKRLPDPQGLGDQELELVCELGYRLSRLWGYEREIAEANDRSELQAYWRSVKSQEQRNIDQLKRRIERQLGTTEDMVQRRTTG